MAVAVMASLMIIRENDCCRLNAILPAINEAIFNPAILLTCEDKRIRRCANFTFQDCWYAV